MKNINRFLWAVEETKKIVSKNLDIQKDKRRSGSSSAFSKFGKNNWEEENNFYKNSQTKDKSKIPEKKIDFPKTSIDFGQMFKGNTKMESENHIGIKAKENELKKENSRRMTAPNVKKDYNKIKFSENDKRANDYIPIDFLKELLVKNSNSKSIFSK
jgi:hypothetical protein